MFDAVPLLTVYLALLTLIPSKWVVPGLGGAGAPASLFGVGLFALWCCIQLLPNVSTRRTPFRWVLLVEALVIAVSYALGHDRGLTAAESLSADRALIVLASINGLVLMTSEGLPTPAHFIRLTRRFTYFVGWMAAVGLVQFFFRFDIYSIVRFPGLVLNFEITGLGERGSGGFVRVKSSALHPIEFAVAMSLALPLALHHALHEVNAVLRKRRYMLLVLIAVSSTLSVSRSAIVSLVGAFLVLVWAWSPKTRTRIASIALMGVAGLQVMVPGLLGTIKSLFLNWNNDDSISGRTDDYSIAGRYIADRPWFGRGYGTFIPDQYIILDNAYLERMIATGLVGFGMMVIVFFSGFLMARHSARRNPSNMLRHMSVTVMAQIMAGIISAATFDLFSFPTATGFVFLNIGLAAALARSSSDSMVPVGSQTDVFLRDSYRVGYISRPWWHRFDAETDTRRKAIAPGTNGD